MKKTYRNIRIALFTILIIAYYILMIFVNDDNMRWIELLILILSICFGIAIILLDIKKIATNKKKIIASIVLLLLAVALYLTIERYIYNFNLPLKLMTILAFVIVYAIFLNYELFSIEYK